MKQIQANVYQDMWKDYPVIRIVTPMSTAVISLLGAQVISFVPKGQEDMLWVSDRHKQPPAPIRGGIPVCWPYFSRQGQPDDVPFHGIARTVFWGLVSQHIHSDGSVTLIIEAPDFVKYAAQLFMEVKVGYSLIQRLITKNIGDVPLSLTQALHTYFRVNDVNAVRVKGVNGCRFVDKFEGAREIHQQEGDWRLDDGHNPGRSDRIYQDVQGSYQLIDELSQRVIDIQTKRSQSLVIWNPGEKEAGELADIGSQWKEFVCVETVNAGPDVIMLIPGGEYCLEHELRIEKLASA